MNAAGGRGDRGEGRGVALESGRSVDLLRLEEHRLAERGEEVAVGRGIRDGDGGDVAAGIGELGVGAHEELGFAPRADGDGHAHLVVGQLRASDGAEAGVGPKGDLSHRARAMRAIPSEIYVVTVESLQQPFADEPPSLETLGPRIHKVHIKAGYMDGKVLSAAEVAKLAAVPAACASA